MTDEAIVLQVQYVKSELMYAAKHGHVEVASALMERMSDEAIALQDKTALTIPWMGQIN